LGFEELCWVIKASVAWTKEKLKFADLIVWKKEKRQTFKVAKKGSQKVSRTNLSSIMVSFVLYMCL